MIKIEQHQNFKLADLKPHPHNPKIHTKAQIEALAKSIKTFGWVQPIVCDDTGTILAGHGRRLAAESTGVELVPVWQVFGLTPEQKSMLLIADNKINMLTEFDNDFLKINLELIGGDLLGEWEELELKIPEMKFEPASFEEQGKIDELEPDFVQCPSCEHVFDLRSDEKRFKPKD